jgi:hypothetical protein
MSGIESGVVCARNAARAKNAPLRYISAPGLLPSNVSPHASTSRSSSGTSRPYRYRPSNGHVDLPSRDCKGAVTESLRYWQRHRVAGEPAPVDHQRDRAIRLADEDLETQPMESDIGFSNFRRFKNKSVLCSLVTRPLLEGRSPVPLVQTPVPLVQTNGNMDSMSAPAYLVDHMFICTAARGPAAELLRQAGLTEGTPNRHPGQGTACRRFFFSNAMLELLWLEDEAESRSEQTYATKLWERFAPGPTASPFGVILRPAPGYEPVCPWPSWSYRPPAMPGLELEIAADTDLDEPMWCFMKTGRAPAEWPERLQPLDHPAGFREITRLLINCPDVKETSVTRAMANNGVIALQTGVEHLLELQFDGGLRGTSQDFRPALPLILRV